MYLVKAKDAQGTWGSTQATIENGKIYKGGSTWASVSDAQKKFDCDGNVAATLWVLFQIGVLP